MDARPANTSTRIGTRSDARQAKACTPTAGIAFACWLIVGSVSAAFGQADEAATAPASADNATIESQDDGQQATRTLEATGLLEATGDAIALDTEPLQAVAQSMVMVTPKSPDGSDDFMPTYAGVIVPARQGETAAGWVVIPYPHELLKAESIKKQTSEFRNDPEKWDAWWKSQFDGASVQGDGWSSKANFVEAQFMLDLVLLQLAESERARPALDFNMQPKHEQQMVIVHRLDARRRQAAQLTIRFPDDTHPWQIELTDLSNGPELVPGSPVTNLHGQLLGVVSRHGLVKKIPVAERGGRDDIYRMIPARYAEVMVALQHPGVSGDVVSLMIGIAMGKERALVDERDAVLAGNAFQKRSGPGGMGRGRRGAAALPPPREPRELKVYALERVGPKVAAAVLTRLFGDRASFSSLPNKPVVTATGPADVLESVEALLKALDQETTALVDQTPDGQELVVSDPDIFNGQIRFPFLQHSELRVYALQHVSPVAAMEAMTPLFRQMTKIEETNYLTAEFVAVPSRGVLIARAAPETLENISALIRTLDTASAEEQSDTNAAATPPATPDADSDEATRTLEATGSLAEPAAPVPGSRIDVFPLKHVTLNEMQSVLSELFGQVAKFSSIPSQNAIVVQGHPDLVIAVNQIVAYLDKTEIGPGTKLSPLIMASSLINEGGQALQPDTQLLIYWLQHLPADEAATTLLALFGQPQGPMDYGAQVRRFVPVSRLNVLVTRAEPEMLKKVDALLKRIDVPSEPNSTTESPINTDGVEIEVGTDNGQPVPKVKQPPDPEDLIADKLPEAIAALRSEYASLDEKVRLAAWRLKKESNADAAGQRQKDVHDAVGEAFDARQQLQHLELRALTQRIESMKRTLATRAKIRDEIVQRRVEELLNPALEWDTTSLKPAATSSGDDAAGNPGSPTGNTPETLTETARTPLRIGDHRLSAESAGPLPREALPTTSPYAAVETSDRIYRGKSQDQWQSEFAAETDPASKLVAALALVSLAAELPPDQCVEQLLDIGEEVVRSSYGDRALEFAFGFSMPPQNMLFAPSDEWKNTYVQFDKELTARLSALAPELLAQHVAPTMVSGSDARAAFAYSLLSWNAQNRIYANEAAALTIVETHGMKIDNIDRSALRLMARLYGALRIPHKAPELWPEIIELAGQLQLPENAGRPINRQVREVLFNLAAQVGPESRTLRKPGDPAPRVSTEASRAMAELALDTIVRDERRILSEWVAGHLGDTSRLGLYAAPNVAAFRSALEPTLHGFADLATTYFHDHTAPFHDEERAVAHELGVVLSLYSDGDEWGIERPAAMLTAQLRAAYTDDPAKTIDVPMHDLLPADAWTHLAQIVAITGEIPDFIGTATPKSKAVADKLATLDRLLAGEVVEDRVDDERRSLKGLLAEAPVEAIRRLIAATDEKGVVQFGPSEKSGPLSLLGSTSFLNPLMDPLPEWYGKAEGFPPYETIDPLLLLAIFNSLTGASEAQDLQIAALFRVHVKNGELGDHINILLASPLQSRKHAWRMLREMAAKTGSSELRDRLLIIDPTIGEAPLN